jgi:hypothetical protein
MEEDEYNDIFGVTQALCLISMGDLSMSIENNIIDASHDLMISVGHNITYLSIKYYLDYLI